MENNDVFKVICGDFFRRQRVIKEGKAHSGVIIAYTLINEMMLTALDKIYTDSGCYRPDIRRVLLHDFATNTGYANSKLRDVISHNTYNNYKKMAKNALMKLLQI